MLNLSRGAASFPLQAVLLILVVGAALGYLLAYYEREQAGWQCVQRWALLLLQGGPPGGLTQLGQGNQSLAALPVSALAWYAIKRVAARSLAG